MASSSALFQPDRFLDGFDLAASRPTTPTVAQQPLWAFRQSFDQKPWSSGAVSVTSFFLYCSCANRGLQLIHDRHQHSSTWSSPSEAKESTTSSLSSRQLAAMLQRQFDEEDHLLAAQLAELAAEQQRVFDCGVCMDTLPEDSIARIEPCGHPFCRECVRGFIVSQIESRRYPVLCPTCTAGPGKSRPESIGSYVSSDTLGGSGTNRIM